MKSFKILILFIVLLFKPALAFSQDAGFSCKKSTHKFGKVKEGILLEHEFVFTNTGSAPLIITDYAVSCKCTKAVFPKEPILPGQTGTVKVTFDTNHKYFYQDRTITLLVNTKRKTATLRFKVYVEPIEQK